MKEKSDVIYILRSKVEVGKREHNTGGKNGKTTVQLLAKSQAIYFILVAEQYQNAKLHNMHITPT
jgi:hypothetical protein